MQGVDRSCCFLEESVRTLAEMNVLVGARGAYRVATPLETTQLPATVQAVLAARVDRLPPEEKRLLQSAAVIGKDVPVGLLQVIADLPEPELRGSLTHLQAAEFLYERSLFPDLECISSRPTVPGRSSSPGRRCTSAR
jgi:predicted ATPase